MTADYPALQRDLAEVLCPSGAERGPCHSCEDAAYRVVAKRKQVRELLVAFAHSEADLAAGDMAEGAGT